MVRRLFSGLVLGVLLGGAVAAAIVFGLKILTFTGPLGALVAYTAAAATGALTGLVAGKPIWAAGAKVEAGLKAFFGALLAAGAMFALRQWAPGFALDLAMIHAGGPAPVGDLPAAALPLIAATLAGLFELDNTGDGGEPVAKRRVEVAGAASRARKPVSVAEEDDDLEPPAASKGAGGAGRAGR